MPSSTTTRTPFMRVIALPPAQIATFIIWISGCVTLPVVGRPRDFWNWATATEVAGPFTPVDRPGIEPEHGQHALGGGDLGRRVDRRPH